MSHSEPVSSPSATEIVSALDRTGFIFEYRVAQQLRKTGFDPYMSHIYIDSESGKTREIDVYAIYEVLIKNTPGTRLFVQAIMLVECKNYKDPLVLVGESRPHGHPNRSPTASFDPLAFEYPRRPASRHGGIEALLKLYDYDSARTHGFLGSQLLKMNRRNGQWQATNEAVYDSIVHPLAKASEYEHQDIVSDPDDEESTYGHDVVLSYVLPVLVTAGPLFAVDVAESAAPEVREQSWAPLTRQFHEGAFKMDVVSFPYIKSYVAERVMPVLNDTEAAVKPLVSIVDPNWVINEYGMPSEPAFARWLRVAGESGSKQ